MSEKKKKDEKKSQSYIPHMILTIAILIVAIFIVLTDVDFPFEIPFVEDLRDIVSAVLPKSELTPEKVFGEMQVYVIDVGQGSSTLFVSNKRSILIDAGENGNGKKILSLMNNIGLDSLDVMIGTHPHSDHIGGMDEVLNSINAEVIIMPELPKSVTPTTKTYLDVLKSIDSQGKSITAAKPGDVFEVGDMKLEIIGPKSAIDSNLNNFSVISKITIDDVSVLITGDAEVAAENAIMGNKKKLKSDILIVGHHGSDTSSSEEFLKAVEPEYAAISVGYNNAYGHPSKETSYKLLALNSKIYRTDRNGTTIFKIQNNEINSVATEKEIE